MARISAATAVLVLGACAGPGVSSLYVHPNADFSIYERVAVLPLDNLSTERFAGDRIREILIVELSAQGLFDVVEIGEVNRALRVLNLANVSDLGPKEIAQVGEALGVQGLFFGSVMEFRERRSGTITTPDIALSLRMLDVEAGLVVWSASDSRSGVGMWTRLFGVGEESQSDSARELVRSLIASFYGGGSAADSTLASEKKRRVQWR